MPARDVPETDRGVTTERHFAAVAPSYTALRQTDDEPVLWIGDRLPDGPLLGVDVGAGTGRYTALMAKMLGKRATIHAVDRSRAMLRVLPAQHGPDVCRIACSEAERLPLATGSVDFMTTFNAVHHFDLDAFVSEAARVLVPDGHLFVYTRTPKQNTQSLWGRAFPQFAVRENRLHALTTLRQAVRHLGSVDVASFSFPRRATRAELAQRVRGHAYSTFALYQPDELDAALHQFLQALGPSDEVRWEDHNTLLHVQRKSRPGLE